MKYVIETNFQGNHDQFPQEFDSKEAAKEFLLKKMNGETMEELLRTGTLKIKPKTSLILPARFQ